MPIPSFKPTCCFSLAAAAPTTHARIPANSATHSAVNPVLMPPSCEAFFCPRSCATVRGRRANRSLPARAPPAACSRLDRAAAWVGNGISAAFFASLERCSCINLATEEEDEAKDVPLIRDCGDFEGAGREGMILRIRRQRSRRRSCFEVDEAHARPVAAQAALRLGDPAVHRGDVVAAAAPGGLPTPAALLLVAHSCKV
ncbi:hypothetical protein ZIOFF_074232 [Zingiber officinale]|uniref:Uncharacterized protein n=1 Tax=Zingiber officinale TaxID=94328 RepID=A0A8J5BZT7_ZINOF|nr:hypothetical protein ZIOFF_074232 [Zingiber officinale]